MTKIEFSAPVRYRKGAHYYSVDSFHRLRVPRRVIRTTLNRPILFITGHNAPGNLRKQLSYRC